VPEEAKVNAGDATTSDIWHIEQVHTTWQDPVAALNTLLLEKLPTQAELGTGTIEIVLQIEFKWIPNTVTASWKRPTGWCGICAVDTEELGTNTTLAWAKSIYANSEIVAMQTHVKMAPVPDLRTNRASPVHVYHKPWPHEKKKKKEEQITELYYTNIIRKNKQNEPSGTKWVSGNKKSNFFSENSNLPHIQVTSWPRFCKIAAVMIPTSITEPIAAISPYCKSLKLRFAELTSSITEKANTNWIY
jgi:hypothetical protein